MAHSDTALVNLITKNLTDYQEILIANAKSGRAEAQCITPTVTLTFAELRKLTNRTKIRTALILKLVGLLEDEGLEVDVEPDQIVITKPAADLETDFDSVKDLEKLVKALHREQAQLKLVNE